MASVAQGGTGGAHANSVLASFITAGRRTAGGSHDGVEVTPLNSRGGPTFWATATGRRDCSPCY